MKTKNRELLVTLGFMILLVFTTIYDLIVRNGEKIPRIALIAVTIIGTYIFYRKSF
ncbi:hypothetical protein JCM1393_02090 [Clostridium carnis]